MNNLSFIAFDLETATNNPVSICQLGYVIVENGRIVNEKSYLVQPPGNEYEARHSCLTLIDALRTRNEPFFPEIWEHIKNDFIDNLLVAHNISFDYKVLNSTLEYYNLPKPEFRCDCTYKMSGLNLKALSEALNIKMEKHHDALSDARVCAQAYLFMKQGIIPNRELISEVENKDVFSGHERLSGEVLKPDLDIENTSSPFYSKKVVFTGVLQTLSRNEAAKIIKDLGADIDTGISKRTDFVIVGQGAGPSKLKKIEEYNSMGSTIEILNESEFIKKVNKE